MDCTMFKQGAHPLAPARASCPNATSDNPAEHEAMNTRSLDGVRMSAEDQNGRHSNRQCTAPHSVLSRMAAQMPPARSSSCAHSAASRTAPYASAYSHTRPSSCCLLLHLPSPFRSVTQIQPRNNSGHTQLSTCTMQQLRTPNSALLALPHSCPSPASRWRPNWQTENTPSQKQPVPCFPVDHARTVPKAVTLQAHHAKQAVPKPFAASACAPPADACLFTQDEVEGAASTTTVGARAPAGMTCTSAPGPVGGAMKTSASSL